MRKQLGLLTTLIVLSASALCWAGSSRGSGYYDYSQYGDYGDYQYADQGPAYSHYNQRPSGPSRSCPPPCEPTCAPHCPSGTSEICTDGVIVTATQPKLCILGDNYVLDLTVKACIDVCHVEVNAMLPDGVTLVKSDPEGATQKNDQIGWVFDSMKKGEVRHSRVTLRADREGDLCVCFCVTAVPVQFCTILCAKPILECSKCGPEEVCPGDPIHYTITVTNKGSCNAEEVVVTDIVPDGIEHSSGLRTLTFKLGTIEPCQTKKINACFTAVKRGKVCNKINVTACNANPTSCEWCTCICCCAVDLVKTGPKERMIGGTADYQITVTNPGDKTLTNVVVTDQAPSATSIVSVKPEGSVSGNQAVWQFPELKPGEKKDFFITLTTCTPGFFCNKVHVDNSQHCQACAEACTRWKGRAALNACFGDSENPICIGETNTYTLRLTNQGSEEDTNVNVVIRFPAEITPLSASGDSQAKVSGNTVTFAPIKTLGPRQTVQFRVEGQAKQSGDARIKAEITSDSIKTPIVEEDSTIVN